MGTCGWNFNIILKTYKVINSMVEYFAYNEEVNGSSPLLPIK